MLFRKQEVSNGKKNCKSTDAKCGASALSSLVAGVTKQKKSCKFFILENYPSGRKVTSIFSFLCKKLKNIKSIYTFFTNLLFSFQIFMTALFSVCNYLY